MHSLTNELTNLTKKGDGMSYKDCYISGNRGLEKGKQRAGRWAQGGGLADSEHNTGAVCEFWTGAALSALAIRTSPCDFIAFQSCWHLQELDYGRVQNVLMPASSIATICKKLQRAKLSALLSGYVFAELTPTVSQLDLFRGVFARRRTHGYTA